MSTLLLRLAGPMQSWADSSRFSVRAAGAEPSKSGVVGLLAAAQGRRRTDPIEDLAGLQFGVRVDQRGQLLRDFQTARSMDGRRVMPLAYRFYLSDAVFVAGVSGDRSLIDGLAQAVRRPAFPLFLGRRTCTPSQPVFLDRVDEPVEEALRAAAWQAAEWYRRRQGRELDLELVMDRDAVQDSPGDVFSVQDMPLSFDPVRREYGWRDVSRVAPVRVQNQVGRAAPDFMAVHGGA